MGTAVQDPTHQPGKFVFGFSLPGMSSFGSSDPYPQQAVFGARSFGGQVAGLSVEDEMFELHEGAPDSRSPRHLGAAPFMSVRKKTHWIHRVIYQTIKGRQRHRRYTPYDGSPKEHLTPFMPKFAEAVALWKTFPAETKTALNARASKLGLQYSGYNHWLSLWLKDDPARLQYLP